MVALAQDVPTSGPPAGAGMGSSVEYELSLSIVERYSNRYLFIYHMETPTAIQDRNSTFPLLHMHIHMNTHTHTYTTILPLSGLWDNLGKLVPEGTFRHLLDFLVQNEVNTGRRTNNPDGLPLHPD